MSTDIQEELRNTIASIVGEPRDLPASSDGYGNAVYIGDKYPKTNKLIPLINSQINQTLDRLISSLPLDKQLGRGLTDEQFAGASAFNVAIRRCRESIEKERRKV